MRQNGLQSTSGITKSVKVDYKEWQGLQSVMGLQSVAVQLPIATFYFFICNVIYENI